MRFVAMISGLVVLSSCRKHTRGYDNRSLDSSPIIISDGSIHLKHAKRFHVDGPQDAHVTLQGYRPDKLGYQCDPDPHDQTRPRGVAAAIPRFT